MEEHVKCYLRVLEPTACHDPFVASCVMYEGNTVAVNNHLTEDTPLSTPIRVFELDGIFDSSHSNERVFDSILRPLVDAAVVDCTDLCLMAYGTQKSGKTRAIFGPQDAGQGAPGEPVDPQSAGLLHQSLQRIFTRVNSEQEREFIVSIAVLHFLNGQVFDLVGGSNEKLMMKESANGDTYFQNSSTRVVRDYRQAAELIRTAQKNYPVPHLTSLFSHTTTVAVEVSLHSRSIAKPDERKLAKLFFVDLQASNRVNIVLLQPSESNSLSWSGIRGLSTLGNCISALASRQNRPAHIPYRDHQLTRMLRNCLGGSGRLVFLLCARCEDEKNNPDEVISGIRMCCRARQIKNRVEGNPPLPDGRSAFDLLKNSTLPQRFFIESGAFIPEY